MKIKRIKWGNVVIAVLCLITIIDLLVSVVKVCSGASLTSLGLLINGFEIIWLYFVETNY